MASCCQTREQVLDRARRAAEELRARRTREGALEEAEEPMKRYIHPIPCCCPGWSAGSGVELDGVLEALARQNQLLLDLLGSVNALSAAVLSIQSRL
ncbi:hypothetical protein [uncultured Flavonifractor sp.]|uniref:hypothetical protein n=1 Tax=uncultured Flavonifractor sp. TaxID=1193534 RepID=UPI0026117EB3|nr:hypothetical protein [uncultured Flavonifractor sp.]